MLKRINPNDMLTRISNTIDMKEFATRNPFFIFLAKTFIMPKDNPKDIAASEKAANHVSNLIKSEKFGFKKE